MAAPCNYIGYFPFDASQHKHVKSVKLNSLLFIECQERYLYQLVSLNGKRARAHTHTHTHTHTHSLSLSLSRSLFLSLYVRVSVLFYQMAYKIFMHVVNRNSIRFRPTPLFLSLTFTCMTFQTYMHIIFII